MDLVGAWSADVRGLLDKDTAFGECVACIEKLPNSIGM